MNEEDCNQDACGRCVWCEYEMGNHSCPKCGSLMKYDGYIGRLKCVECKFEVD